MTVKKNADVEVNVAYQFQLLRYISYNSQEKRRRECQCSVHFLCLFLGSPGFNGWFSFAPVFQWVVFDNPGFSKCLNIWFLLSPHLCFSIGFIFDLLPVMVHRCITRPPHGPNKYMFTPLWKLRARVGIPQS